ncbi:cell wall-active antibiotics response protein LiaF [Gottfriedia solisilvae]|uniref:Transporter n=1 Tax=Gottfriedia solisilvae TaxID=1516104 RepID=A0A8J3AMR5_9BACI|nr:cell wall-active antibiotics response protein LiaF [Gottfriedia solisilvae]GGI13511.1 transporter [Gottfriedia solisilvae]
MKHLEHLRRLSSNELIGILFIIAGIGLLFDLFLNPFAIIAAGVGIYLIQYGAKKRKVYPSTSANIAFFGGIILFISNVFQLKSILGVLAFIVIYIGYLIFINSKLNEKIVIPLTQEKTSSGVFEAKSLISNRFFSNIRMKNDTTFELDDVDYYFGIGDIEIDLTDSFIPEGETVLAINGLIGNITLYVPYDVELTFHHATLFGKVNILKNELKGFNKNCKFTTNDYKEASRKLKIITSLAVGKIEVTNR